MKIKNKKNSLSNLVLKIFVKIVCLYNTKFNFLFFILFYAYKGNSFSFKFKAIISKNHVNNHVIVKTNLANILREESL